jgi:hypothetical protein
MIIYMVIILRFTWTKFQIILKEIITIIIHTIGLEGY